MARRTLITIFMLVAALFVFGAGMLFNHPTPNLLWIPTLIIGLTLLIGAAEIAEDLEGIASGRIKHEE